MDDDFEHAIETRELQNSPQAIAANLASMQLWTKYNLLKAVPAGNERVSVGGYITTLAALSGRTPREMENLLGLRVNQLATGADIYRLSKIPTAEEFRPRGYSTLVDGLTLKAGKTDCAGFRPGEGAWQITLLVPIAATRIRARLGRDEVFEPGPHPKYLAQYGRG